MTQAETSSLVAARMRAYRRRRRRGVWCVQIEVGPAETESLIAKGYLSSKERDDPEAVQYAADCFFSDALAPEGSA